MTIRRVLVWVAPGVIALGAATGASAQTRDEDRDPNRGFYVGAQVGTTRFPDDGNVEVGALSMEVIDADREELARSIGAGYRFSKYFATELGYVDLGEARFRLADVSGATDARSELRFAVKGPTVSFVGMVPFGKWEPFLRVGLLFSDVDAVVNGIEGVTPFSGRGTSDSTHVYWGAGIGYNFNERWQVKAELNHYSDIGDRNVTGTADILTATIGFTFRF